VFWHATCFNKTIEMTLHVKNAPGHALKIDFLSFHGCRYRQPFPIPKVFGKGSSVRDAKDTLEDTTRQRRDDAFGVGDAREAKRLPNSCEEIVVVFTRLNGSATLGIRAPKKAHIPF
jgi:hypothetical protein